MAIEIKSLPVLEGQAAQDFYNRWDTAVETKSSEEVRESMNKWSNFFAQQKQSF